MHEPAEIGPFLSIIRAEPDDDTARLVFADWLEEYGDQDRADLIRLQCDLARRGSPTPSLSAAPA